MSAVLIGGGVSKGAFEGRSDASPSVSGSSEGVRHRDSGVGIGGGSDGSGGEDTIVAETASKKMVVVVNESLESNSVVEEKVVSWV
jgi:hypothetical protein